MTQNPELYGEEDIGGHMPNPESDDDTLENLQEWGFNLESNAEDHEEEIDLQRDLDRAEKERRQKR